MEIKGRGGGGFPQVRERGGSAAGTYISTCRTLLAKRRRNEDDGPTPKAGIHIQICTYISTGEGALLTQVDWWMRKVYYI